MKIFLLDNYDSFTYMLKDYIEQCAAECIVKRNDEVELRDNELIECNAIVISPGPKTPNESGVLMKIISTYHSQKPILGVCLGHQGIGEFFGAQLVKSKLPMHGKVDEIVHNDHLLFKNIPQKFSATRYHSLILEGLKLPLEVIAANKNNEVMGIAHQKYPVYGIQFHPESCMTNEGINIIKNFISLAKKFG